MVAVTVDPMSRRDKRATEPSRHHRRAAGEGMPDRESRVAAGLRLLVRRSGLRRRRPLSPHGLPAAPGQRRERAPDLPLAPRPLRPGFGGHARPVRGRRRAPTRWNSRATTSSSSSDPVPTLRAITCTGSKKGSSRGSPSSWPRRCSACSRRSARTKERWRRSGRASTSASRNREAGWGSGLTVLTAMANVLGRLDPADRALALVHGLVFVSRDTVGRPPRFALRPLETALPADRLTSWYRRFVDTRNGDAAERVLATAAASGSASSGDGCTHGRGRHRSPLRRRRPHDRLHQQGLRDPRPSRLGPGRRDPDHARARDGWRVAGGGDRRMAPPRRPGRAAERPPGETGGPLARCGQVGPAPMPGRRRLGVGRPRRRSGGDRRRSRRGGRERRQRGAAGACGRLRGGAATHPVPHPERPRRLGRRPPRLHVRERRPPDGGPELPRPSWCEASTRGR